MDACGGPELPCIVDNHRDPVVDAILRAVRNMLCCAALWPSHHGRNILHEARVMYFQCTVRHDSRQRQITTLHMMHDRHKGRLPSCWQLIQSAALCQQYCTSSNGTLARCGARRKISAESKKHIPTASAIKQKHHRKHIPTTAIGISFSDKNLSDLRPSELLQYTQPVDRLLTLVHACVQSQIEYLTVPFTRGGAQARIPGSRPLCSCGEMSQMIEQSRNVAVSLPSFFGPWDQRRELGVIS